MAVMVLKNIAGISIPLGSSKFKMAADLVRNTRESTEECALGLFLKKRNKKNSSSSRNWIGLLIKVWAKFF